jgi:predicted DNA-binding protein (UPF0251 family)
VLLSDWKEVAAYDGELSEYRKRTIALLRKYFLMSIELGHLPSLFGREFFRSNVSSYATHTFEDTAIFVHDMERTMELLEPVAQAVLARLVFQEFSCQEAAELLGISRRHLRRRFAEALDSLSQLLLDRGLLQPAHQTVSATQALALSKKDEQQAPKVPPSAAPILHRPLFPKCCQVGGRGQIRLLH